MESRKKQKTMRRVKVGRILKEMGHKWNWHTGFDMMPTRLTTDAILDMQTIEKIDEVASIDSIAGLPSGGLSIVFHKMVNI